MISEFYPFFDRKFAKESKLLRKTLKFSLGGHFLPKEGWDDLTQKGGPMVTL
jgi:hypothetical protein